MHFPCVGLAFALRPSGILESEQDIKPDAETGGIEMGYELYTEIHINRYLEYVQKVEEKALQAANTQANRGHLYRRVGNRLGAQLRHLGRGLRRAVMATAPSEHPVR
jgi:hypothetical protein